MNLIERIVSNAFYDNGHLYHSVESAKGFFEAKCKQHNLVGWEFKVVSSTKKRNIGYCNYRRKLIAIQAHFFFAMTAAQIEETILHELAHALTPGEGHSLVWRAKAIELGDTNARARTNIRADAGFRSDWMINSGHTRSESEFDCAAFTNTSKKPTQPTGAKRVAKPTKLAVKLYSENIGNMAYFITEMMDLGYKYEYAVIQWKLAKSFS